MDKYNKRNNRESNNITDEKNKDKNIKNDIFNSKENSKTKIKANNKKEEDKIFIYQSSINKIKPEYDINSNKERKKLNNNKLLKAQSYFIIKLRKLFLLLNIIITYMNFYALLCEYNQGSISSRLSEITLKINLSENIKLFSQKYNHFEIYFNNTPLEVEGNEYHYIESNNSEKEGINY